MILLIGATGYIGSALYPALASITQVDCLDIGRRGNPAKIPFELGDYGAVRFEKVRNYDTIILLAAHSSVGQAANDSWAAFHNNVVKFHRLLEMVRDDQRLIYASSSSVYSGFGAAGASEDAEAGNLYDLSKYIDDALATLSHKHCYGLRFGTVNGPSPNIRNDLMLNRMVRTAKDHGRVEIQNPQVRRPILGIHDLVRAVTAIVNGDGLPGTYNLASCNATVQELGALVADAAGVPLIIGEPTNTYDFEIDTTKFQKMYDFTFQESARSIVSDLMEFTDGGSR